MVGGRDGDGASAGVTGELVGVPVISFVFVSFTCTASVLFVCLFGVEFCFSFRFLPSVPSPIMHTHQTVTLLFVEALSRCHESVTSELVKTANLGLYFVHTII